jgi:hypothetical protein
MSIPGKYTIQIHAPMLVVIATITVSLFIANNTIATIIVGFTDNDTTALEQF